MAERYARMRAMHAETCISSKFSYSVGAEMGTGGARYGAGRPGWHAKAEACLRLDVWSMQRAGCLAAGRTGSWFWTVSDTGERVGSVGYSVAPGALVLRYQCGGKPREDWVRLTYTRGPVGGDRPWFVCPIKGERVAILYQRHGRFACRRCNHIAYASQSEDVVGRTWRRQGKLEARLVDGFKRPTGMHDATYTRLLDAIEECEAVRDGALLSFIDRHGW